MTNSHDDPKAPESVDDHAVSHGMIDDMRDRIEAGWDTLKTTVRTKFHKLTVEDLELNEIKGKLDELVHRIAARYGYDDTRAREELSRFLSVSDTPEDAKSEDAKSEDAKSEEAEAPKADASKAEAPKAEEPKSHEAKAEAPKKPGRKPAGKVASRNTSKKKQRGKAAA